MGALREGSASFLRATSKELGMVSFHPDPTPNHNNTKTPKKKKKNHAEARHRAEGETAENHYANLSKSGAGALKDAQ